MKYTIERYPRYPIAGGSYREFSNIFINYSLINKVWPRDIDTSFRICRNI